MDKKELTKLRKEIVLNSLFTDDYENSFGIDKRLVQTFFDGYMEELNYLLEEKLGKENVENLGFGKYYDELFKLDTIDNLYNYYCSCEDIGF